MRGAREAFGEALADELGVDLDASVMRIVDKVLMRLFLFGFVMRPIKGLTKIMDAIR